MRDDQLQVHFLQQYWTFYSPCGGVRCRELQVIPGNDVTVERITRNKLLTDEDPQVRLQAFLTLADVPSSELAAIAAVEGLREPANFRDQHIRDAATSALARHARFAVPELARLKDLPADIREPLAIIAEHAARRSTTEPLDLTALIAGLNQAQPEVSAIVVRGLVAGWPDRSAAEQASQASCLRQAVGHLVVQPLISSVGRLTWRTEP